jgi:hypothetical protein
MLSEGLITNAATANDFAPLTRLPHHSSHTSHTDASSSPLRHAPTRIARTEYLRPGSLEPAQFSALMDQLYQVYSETVHGFTREELAVHIAAHNARLAIFYGTNDELAGFSCARIERAEQAGRTRAVFWAVVYFRSGYHGGLASAFFGLAEALRFKLRHPLTPIAYFTRASSPAVYRLLASTMPRIYPSLESRAPEEVEGLVRELSARWHYVPVGDNPWIVQSRAVPRDPSRLRALSTDRYVRFYTELNPRYAEGEALLTWLPLDMINIARGLVRALRRRFAHE